MISLFASVGPHVLADSELFIEAYMPVDEYFCVNAATALWLTPGSDVQLLRKAATLLHVAPVGLFKVRGINASLAWKDVHQFPS